MTAKERGVAAWRQYVEDIQAWKEEYVRLAQKFAEYRSNTELPGGDLTENDTN